MANRPSDSSKLRVLFIHTATRPPLGADTWIQALVIRHLDRGQHEVHVACATGPEGQPTPTFGAMKDIPELSIKPVNLGSELFKEPFGLVYAEAMAMKKPVVAFDNGGTPEVVEHEKSGRLSPQDDLPALVANLRRLIRDPELRRQMGGYGRQRVETHFVPRRLAEDVARVYTQLMGRS